MRNSREKSIRARLINLHLPCARSRSTNQVAANWTGGTVLPLWTDVNGLELSLVHVNFLNGENHAHRIGAAIECGRHEGGILT